MLDLNIRERRVLCAISPEGTSAEQVQRNIRRTDRPRRFTDELDYLNRIGLIKLPMSENPRVGFLWTEPIRLTPAGVEARKFVISAGE